MHTDSEANRNYTDARFPLRRRLARSRTRSKTQSTAVKLGSTPLNSTEKWQTALLLNASAATSQHELFQLGTNIVEHSLSPVLSSPRCDAWPLHPLTRRAYQRELGSAPESPPCLAARELVEIHRSQTGQHLGVHCTGFLSTGVTSVQ